MTTIFNFLLLLVFVLPSSSNPRVNVDVHIKDCSPKELVIAQGKCSLYVNDLIGLTEEYKGKTVSLEVAKNMSNVCKSVTSCFGGLQCVDAEKNFKLYQQKCEKLVFENYEMDWCIPMFYHVVYEGTENCTHDFNYFSRDMKTKRDAYASGKSCLLEIAEKNCSERAILYLNSNYETFLNILTVPSGDEKCNSLHDELNARQCVPEMAKLEVMSWTVGFASLLRKDEVNNDTAIAICESVKACMNDYCYFTETNQAKYDEICEKVYNETNKVKSFDDCKVFVVLNANSSNYDCLGKTDIDGKAEESSFVNVLGPDSQFMRDKECTRTVMRGECGEESVKDFEKGWENSQEEGRALASGDIKKYEELRGRKN